MTRRTRRQIEKTLDELGEDAADAGRTSFELVDYDPVTGVLYESFSDTVVTELSGNVQYVIRPRTVSMRYADARASDREIVDAVDPDADNPVVSVRREPADAIPEDAVTADEIDPGEDWTVDFNEVDT